MGGDTCRVHSNKVGRVRNTVADGRWGSVWQYRGFVAFIAIIV